MIPGSQISWSLTWRADGSFYCSVQNESPEFCGELGGFYLRATDPAEKTWLGWTMQELIDFGGDLHTRTVKSVKPEDTNVFDTERWKAAQKHDYLASGAK